MSEYDKELERLDNCIKQQNKLINTALYQQKLYIFGYVFWYRFTNQDDQKATLFRNHIGSSIAIGMACHNTYYMKQSIIKQAIYLSKSKNPNTIKLLRVPLTGLYFGVLTALWHIPSLSTEIAFRLYAAVGASIFSLVVTPDDFFRIISPRQLLNQ